MEKVKVIVVDDSAFMRRAISEMIESEADFEVVAKFRDGRELIDKVDQYKPDIITLDVHMKNMDGLEVLKELKASEKSYPIIVVSSQTTEGSELTLECLENGAISFITKPSGNISLDIAKVQDNLINQIKSIVYDSRQKEKKSKLIIPKPREIETVKNDEVESDLKVNETTIFETKNEVIRKNASIPYGKKIDAVVIGASTGGPRALQEVLTKLPKDLGVPVFVVQHMPEGFTRVFSERLDKVCNMSVVEAEDSMEIKNNTIYIAKGGNHMIIGSRNMIYLNKEPTVWGVRPAVDKLFNSASNVYGANIISVVLTGMGKDGAEGTKNIKDNGGVTITEDKSTCTIYGMPKAAYETGKVDLVLPLDQVCDKITKIVKGI